MYQRLWKGPDRGVRRLSRDALTSLSRHLLLLPWGELKAFPGRLRDIVPPACPRASPGPLPGGTCLEHLLGGGGQEASHIDAQATSTDSI
ncbi:hypothetical protein ATANTOWER_030177 [Ataeniobius toweri]|uniref:Uncharacterized protein n=1 Tax=Ataeniobius toweri TaxID=208326 RepID=A0ABU7CDL5_9TELE|nr:hypothetical protein [Ataeniobius toweri]